jgi:hypothetical protein
MTLCNCDPLTLAIADVVGSGWLKIATGATEGISALQVLCKLVPGKVCGSVKMKRCWLGCANRKMTSRKEGRRRAKRPLI